MYPKIGIHMPNWPGVNYYVNFMEQYGDVRIIGDDEYDPDLDLLVLTGGNDVDPKRYNQEPIAACGNPNPANEFFDMYVLPKYIDAHVPIFGICRGFQTLAVHAGLSLIQHVKGQEGGDDIVITSHGVQAINSYHHQVVEQPNNADVASVLGYSLDHNTVEAMFFKHFKGIGVQWHPEYMDHCELSDIYIHFLLSNDRSLGKLLVRKPRSNKSLHSFAALRV